MLVSGKRLAVFSIRSGKNGSVWVRAGSAWVNKDGSMNVRLDVLPIDGVLHVREAGERRAEAVPNVPGPFDATESGMNMNVAAGGH